MPKCQLQVDRLAEQAAMLETTHILLKESCLKSVEHSQVQTILVNTRTSQLISYTKSSLGCTELIVFQLKHCNTICHERDRFVRNFSHCTSPPEGVIRKCEQVNS